MRGRAGGGGGAGRPSALTTQPNKVSGSEIRLNLHISRTLILYSRNTDQNAKIQQILKGKCYSVFTFYPVKTRSEAKYMQQSPRSAEPAELNVYNNLFFRLKPYKTFH